ncbi:beta-ketoacyl reductase, partial [Streptomyces sp. NBC_00878]|uniref:beta-ketoacyl reductase n=1 Tax=Streptomyces sp. NBC_00878 TaxID=2975854 RepID=UPI002253DDBA
EQVAAFGPGALFVEIGPDGSLSRLTGGVSAAEPLTALAHMWVHGVPVDWAPYTGGGTLTQEVPTYPFQHERYWAGRSAGHLLRAHWTPQEPAATGDDVDVLRLEAPDGDPAAAAHELARTTLAAVQRALAEDRRLTVHTDGSLAASVARGLVRSAASEHPGRYELAEKLTLEPVVTDPGARVVLDGTVLVTGASGVLAGLLVRHLVAEYGVSGVVLLSRSEPDVAGLGVPVSWVRGDVSDRSVVEAALTGRELCGVFHVAGGVDDGVVSALSPERLDAVLAPKVDGAWHLHEATVGMPLKAFVVYSSAAGVLGAAGQANYAAANTFLDALIEYRRDRGLPGLSVAWGLWEQATGITRDLASRHAGTGGLPTEVALRLLDTAMRGSAPVVVAAAGDPRTSPSGHDTKGPAALTGLPPERRRRALLDLVQNRVTSTLGLSRAADPGRAFTDLGFTSLTALELRNSIAEETGQPLPASLVFDHPNAGALVGYLDGLLAPEAGTAPSGPAADPLAAAVAALEQALAGVDPVGPQAVATVARLRVLLAGQPDTPPGNGSAATLNTASADDLLDFIDREFGKPLT